MSTDPIRRALAFTPAFARTPEGTEFLSLDQCAELMTAYRRGKRAGILGEDSVWAFHAANAQMPLQSILEDGDPERLRQHLNQVHLNRTLQGYDQHSRQTEKMDAEERHRVFMAKSTYAPLLRLGMATGVVRSFNPEQPENYPYLQRDATEEIIADTLASLGLKGPFPATAAGAYGLTSAHGVLTLRHVIALGYLREVRHVLRSNPGRYTRIVEIGGGMGRTAFHLARDLGLPCTIIDLPMVGVVAHALLTANGVPSRLWPDAAVARAGEVVHLNAFADLDAADFEGALFVNFDSFVEMGADTQSAYFDLVRTARADLLSINHEAAKVMTQGQHRQNWRIARFEDWGYVGSPRRPFWERDGYVVQLFQRAQPG